MARYRFHYSLSVLAAVALLAGCDQDAGSSELAGPRSVKSAAASAAQAQTVRFPGVVQAGVQTDLAFRTLGRVVSRKASVGDLVRAGDIVAEIDPLALELAVRSAEADLRSAEAQRGNALLTQERKQRLAATSAASAADLDLAEQELESAQANVAKANASLDKAREQLGYAKLKAEFDGVVAATPVEVGQTATAGQPVLTIARLDQRDVIVDVPEEYLRSARDSLASASEWDAVALETLLRGLVDELEVKPKQVYQPIRVALTGTTVSPGIFESVAALGREETLARLDKALQKADAEPT